MLPSSARSTERSAPRGTAVGPRTAAAIRAEDDELVELAYGDWLERRLARRTLVRDPRPDLAQREALRQALS